MTRKLAWVFTATDHGLLLLNRYDVHMIGPALGIGVGCSLFETGSHDPFERDTVRALLTARREHFGDGVMVVDCGANVGAFTVPWAIHMTGWGSVLAIEAQERVYGALWGGIIANNCHNARAVCACVGAAVGTLDIPTPNYLASGSFGGLELRRTATTEPIGQVIDYETLTPVRMLSIDSLELPRLDFLKVDVEGMELEVLEGARDTLLRDMPIVLAEGIKTQPADLEAALRGLGYEQWWTVGNNFLAIHPSDPTRAIVEAA